MPNVLRTLLTEVKRIQRSAWNLAKLPTEIARAIIRSILSSPWSDRHAGGVLSGLAPDRHFYSSVQVVHSVTEVQCRGTKSNIDCWIAHPRFLPQQFGAVCGNDSSYYSMHLRSRYLPRPSASSALDNRAPPMANTSQVLDLEGLHHEIHGMAEQMRVKNENNAHLIQLLAAANPQPAPPVPGIERSRHSSRSRGRSNNPVRHQQKARRREGGGVLIETIGSGHETNPPRKKFRDLDARLDAINTGTSAPVTVDTLIKQTEPPFTERILRARISSKFKLPAQLGIYEGKNRSNGPLGLVQEPNVAPGQLFVANFMSCRNRQKNASHLFAIHQKETESLKDFVKRFNQAILEVEDPSDKVIIMAMMEGLRPGPLFDSLSKNVPETSSALQSKADKYIAAEELAEAKQGRRGKDDHKRKELETRRSNTERR
ncbi:hypothetical protein Acr_00g0030910 [Actinidia rufa]|uniref:Retrotransposon gag domain-containing protein n=1 Tax=Actinidia rufa TaxID=165716 RepID=A0A7J0DEY6_9ERIC|nr:hypothetical protein Acr_00g0030910 [Actinidia rufa]